MQIKYWTGFSKRKNSTKQPTGGTTAVVYLKEDTSILNPSFECVGVPENVNYIRVDDWARYYFVTNVQRVGTDRIIIDCEVDTLATYKSSIGAYNGFVEYATSSNNKMIYDSRNKPTGDIDATPTTFTFSSGYFSTTGCYIVSVLNTDNNGVGGSACYYALDQVALQQFCAVVYDTAQDAALKNQWFDVQNSVVSIAWVPIDYNKILPGAASNVHIGKTDLLVVQGKKLSARVYSDSTGSTSINYAAYSGGAGADMTYLENAPFTTGEMYLPFVGIVPINVEECAFSKSMSIHVKFDIITGDIVYQIYYGGVWTQTFNGNMATKMPVSGATYDAVGVASGVLTSIGGVAATFASMIASQGATVPLMAGLGTMAAGATMAAKSSQIHTMINGTNSSALGAHMGLNPFVVIIQQSPTMIDVTEPKAEQGLPYYKTATISSLSGFVKCNNASVSIVGYTEERDTVNDYLNNGFYYE